MESSDIQKEKLAQAKELFKSVLNRKTKWIEYIVSHPSSSNNGAVTTENEAIVSQEQGNDAIVGSDNEISPIELFRRGEMIDEVQCLAIRDVINRKLIGENIQVIRDEGHHDSWACVKYTNAPVRKLYLFSPCQAFKLPTLAEAAKEEMDDLFKQFATDNFKVRNVLRIEWCEKAANKYDEFIYVLAIALCIAMGQRFNAFTIGLGAGGDTKFIRQKIADILEENVLPSQDPEDAVWQPPYY